MESDFMSIAEAAKRLNMSVPGVYAAIKGNRLRCVKIIGKIALTREEVENYRPRRYGSRVAPGAEVLPDA